MEFFLISFLFLNFLKYSFEIVPIWNIESAAIDLKPSFVNNKLTYATNSISGHDLSGKLRKELTINGNTINKKNYLSLNEESEFEVSFEDIESVYHVANSRVICPKGKYHPYKLSGTNFEEFSLSSTNFVENGNWDLKCYFHGAGLSDGGSNLQSPGAGFMMLFYLMNGNRASYNTDFNKNNNNFNWEAGKLNEGGVGEELYDFQLKYGTYVFDTSKNNFVNYDMNVIIKEDNSLKLKCYKARFESKHDMRNGIYIFGEGSSITLSTSKKYNQAYINPGSIPLTIFILFHIMMFLILPVDILPKVFIVMIILILMMLHLIHSLIHPSNL